MNLELAAVLAAAMAAFGAYLIVSSARPGRPPAHGSRPGRRSLRSWLDQAGLSEVSTSEFLVAIGVVGAAGGLGAYLLFDGLAPAVVAGVMCAGFPVAGYRRRRLVRREAAMEEWPRLLEEIRMRAGSLGRSIPQALFESAGRAPTEWATAFSAAEREWLLTTDFARTLTLLKAHLADPVADVVAETLLMAHEVGGSDLETRLNDLIEDRVSELQSRKDANSRLAGVRFARRFVLLVPLGMAVAGLSIGTGRAAYATGGGQLAVVAGLLATAACWLWSGRLMRLPNPNRVFR